ncbi:MAG: phasin family protein [Pseudomonadales bacterium]
MNPIEKQMELGRELMELNAQWFQKIAEFDGQNVQKYVELNQTFAQRLPEVKDVASFVELQREYGETLWNSTQEVVQARSEMVREAFEANTNAVKSAFAEVAPQPAKKTASRTKKAA